MLRAAPIWLLALLLGGAGVTSGGLGGCATGDLPADIAVNADNPFMPIRVRIYPLTRLDLDESGKSIIVCHIEFKDAWGDSVKGTGQLQIQLYRSQETSEVQELRWDVDLEDLGMNAALYDSVTRTYRVQLGSLPQWVDQIAEGQAQGRITLRAILALPTEDGSEVYLQDEFVIEK